MEVSRVEKSLSSIEGAREAGEEFCWRPVCFFLLLLVLIFCFTFLKEDGLEDGTVLPTGSIGDGGAVEVEPDVEPGEGEGDFDDKLKSSIELDEALLGL